MATWAIRVHGELSAQDRAALDQMDITVVGGASDAISGRAGLVLPPAVPPAFSLVLDAETAEEASQKVAAALGRHGPFDVDEPDRIA